MTASTYPPKLQRIIAFFESMPPAEVRAALISYAARIKKFLPPEGVPMDLADVRKDAECEDKVGVFLKFDDAGRVTFYMETGPNVQTLTNALACILCEGLSGETPDTVRDLPQDFVPRIVGGQLFRQRSQTVYYVLRRMKEAVKRWHDGERLTAIAAAKAAEAGQSACSAKQAGDGSSCGCAS